MCRHLETKLSTCRRWVAQYGRTRTSDIKPRKKLEAEIARLKELLAGAELDKPCSGRSLKATSEPKPQERSCWNAACPNLQGRGPAPLNPAA